MSTQTLIIVLVLLFIHWIADFLTQNDWLATNKSKSWVALLCHTALYTITMGIFMNLFDFFGLFTHKYTYSILIFVAILFTTHTIIDYTSSRITSKLYKKGNMRTFFDVIGFDQFMHYLTIFLAYKLLYI